MTFRRIATAAATAAATMAAALLAVGTANANGVATLPTTDKAPTYTAFQKTSDPGKSASDYFQPYWYANDKDGSGAHHIQAHGGGMTKDGDTWYWVGESHENGYSNSPGLHMYSSTDLYNWKDEGIVLRSVTDKAQLTDANNKDYQYFADTYGLKDHPDRAEKIFPYLNTNGNNGLSAIMERPKLLHNPTTGKWIIWFHSDGQTTKGGSNYSRAMLGVAVADSPTGPYRLTGVYKGFSDGTKPSWGEIGDSRDMTAFAAKDGHAYLGYSSEGNKATYVARLDDTWTHLDKTVGTDQSGSKMQYSEDGRYTDITGGTSGVDYRVICRDSREATAFLQHDGDTYAITSATTGWDPNEQNYYKSKDGSMLGEWENKGKLVQSGDTHKSTFGSQVASIIPYDESKGEYIYLGDRWHSGAADSTYVVLPLIVRWPRNLELVNPGKDWTLDYWTQTGVAWRGDSDLQEAVDKAAKLDQSKYTTDSWNNLQSAVATANGLKGSHDQQAIWNAISGVDKAIDKLAYKDGRTHLSCVTSGNGATGPHANDFCWIDWSQLDIKDWDYSKSHPIAVDLPGGTVTADLKLSKTDNANLAAHGFPNNNLAKAYALGSANIGLTMESTSTAWANRKATAEFTNIKANPDSGHSFDGWGMLFGDSEVMSWIRDDHSQYEQTIIESDKTLTEVGLVGDTDPAHSYCGGVTKEDKRITLTGGWDDNPVVDKWNNGDSGGAMVVSADQPTSFKVDFAHYNRSGWSAIAVGVKLPDVRPKKLLPATVKSSDIGARKVWNANGNDRPVTSFKFGLYANADASGTPMQTVNASSDGSIDFHDLTFDQSAFADGKDEADVTYSVKELDTSGVDGMRWDTHVATVNIHLTRTTDADANTITINAKVMPHDVVFTNTFVPTVSALPGTGGVASLVPVFAGMGLAVSLAAAWFVRKRLAD